MNSLKMPKFRNYPFYLVYEGEGEGEGGNGGGSNDGGGDGGDSGATPPPPATPPPSSKKLIFSPEQQTHINKILADERRKGQAANEKTIKELEKLKQSQGRTQEERDSLQARIDELQTQFLSKEELAKKEKEKLEKDHKSTLSTMTTERDQWRDLYHSSTISRSLLDAAIKFEAFNPDQIAAILEKHTRLVEDKDEEGKSRGYIPRVKFTDIDGDGKPILLDLTVTEAVKRMKDLPERFGNLFKSNLTGGIGGNGTTGGRRVEPGKMSTKEYMEARKKDPKLGFTQSR